MNIGDKWNEWTVESFIGEGNFGKVYKIVRREFGHTYESALKVIRIPQNMAEVKIAKNEGMDETSITEYFLSMVEEIVSEFALMSELRGNSNIVSYEDHSVVGLEDSFGWDIYIRMELLTPLFEYLNDRTLTIRDVIRLGIDMCRALEICQKYNIIHRDIKPENIFISKQGNFKLGDFGIARQMEKTSSEMSKKGTFSYMAPEVYKGLPYNSNVDLYSLGIVLYRFLNNNRTPFLPPYPEPIRYSDKEQANFQRMSGGTIAAPCNAQGRLAEIVVKACAYDPKDRYESARDMREALESIAYTEQEARIIYPAGDVIEQPESGTGVTNNEGLSCQEDGTISIFGISDELEIDADGQYEGKEYQQEIRFGNDLISENASVRFDAAHETLNTVEIVAQDIVEKNESIFDDLTDGFIEEEREATTVTDVSSIDNSERKGAVVNEPDISDASETEENQMLISLDKDNESEASTENDSYNTVALVPPGITETKDLNVNNSTIPESSNRKIIVRLRYKTAIAVAIVLICAAPFCYRYFIRSVPAVVGTSSDEARSLIEDSGFRYDESSEFSNAMERGHIISQSHGGEKAKRGTTIDVVVSRGSAIEVPDLAGKTSKEAKVELESLGLVYVAADEKEYSDTLKKNLVIKQSPDPGTKCEEESEITVVLSKGITQVKVPNVIGLTAEEAEKSLNKAGFNAEITNAYNGAVEYGKIYEQSIDAGVKTDKNSTITITQSLGSSPKSSSGASSSNGTKKKKKSNSSGGVGTAF